MLPFQEAMGETSHKQQNLIFNSLFQFRKNYQYPLRRVEVRSKVRLPARDFPIFYCQLAVATFLAIKRSVWFCCYERLRNFLIF